MSEVGVLNPLSNDEMGEYVGRIQTLDLDLFIRFVPQSRSAHPTAPTHDVLAKTKSGTWVGVGAAWLRTMQRGDRKGEAFFSITLDDPGLPHSLNVAAFRRTEGNGFAVTWRRRQAEAPAAHSA